MKPIEIVELIKSETPDLLGKVPEKRVARMLAAAFAKVTAAVANLEEGEVLRVQGLGAFNARRASVEKDGQKTGVRRVLFNASKPASREQSPQDAVAAPDAEPTQAKKSSKKAGLF